MNVFHSILRHNVQAESLSVPAEKVMDAAQWGMLMVGASNRKAVDDYCKTTLERWRALSTRPANA